MRAPLLTAAALLAISGCATTRAIQVNNASVEAPVRAAEELQTARKSPQAELHIQYAKDGLSAAQKLDADHENHRADLMRLRAQSDAELAVAIAKVNTVQGEVDQVTGSGASTNTTSTTNTTTTTTTQQ